MVSESDISLEKALEDLEEIVVSLESGRLPLEESLALFERGVQLIRLASSKLDRAEQRIESLTGELPPDLAGRD